MLVPDTETVGGGKLIAPAGSSGGRPLASKTILKCVYRHSRRLRRAQPDLHKPNDYYSAALSSEDDSDSQRRRYLWASDNIIAEKKSSEGRRPLWSAVYLCSSRFLSRSNLDSGMAGPESESAWENLMRLISENHTFNQRYALSHSRPAEGAVSSQLRWFRN